MCITFRTFWPQDRLAVPYLSLVSISCLVVLKFQILTFYLFLGLFRLQKLQNSCRFGCHWKNVANLGQNFILWWMSEIDAGLCDCCRKPNWPRDRDFFFLFEWWMMQRFGHKSGIRSAALWNPPTRFTDQGRRGGGIVLPPTLSDVGICAPL